MAISRLSFGKCFELLITISCLVLHYKSMGESRQHTVLLANGAFVGYTIILLGLFTGYLLSTPVNKRIDIFFSIVGCAIFIAAGVFIIQEREDQVIKFDTDERKMAMAKGSLAIVNGVLFFFDIIFTFRD